jgi:hypothetical protein
MLKAFLLIFCVFVSIINAEVIDNIVRDEKKFGEWMLICEEDVMFDNISCKISTTFYQNSSMIFIQPNNKIANQVVIMIPSVAENTMIKVKVDKNQVVTSDIIDKKMEYGVIPFSPQKQRLLYSQMIDGEFLLIRFTVRDLREIGGMKDITAKISLIDFGKMITYYNSKINNDLTKTQE